MLLSRMATGEPEVFATVQGEGISCGVPSVFVRLAECNLKCTWCFVPTTPVLMADWSWRAIGDLVVGDQIIGVSRPAERYRHLQLTLGEVVHTGVRRAATVVVNDEVRCTPDHPFWLTGKDAHGRPAAHSGWREVQNAQALRALFTTSPSTHDRVAYERGWLSGMADGDGCFWTLRFRRGYRRFRLALNDECLLARAEEFAARSGFVLRRGTHSKVGFKGPGTMACLWMTADQEARSFEAWVAHDGHEDRSWCAGYLGGILDAEGSLSCRQLRVAQDESANPYVRARLERVLDRLDVSYTADPRSYYLQRSNGDAWRILTTARPGKPTLLAGALGGHPNTSRVIRRVVPSGSVEPVVTLSTSVGSFIAGGYVVKNCDTSYTWDWTRHDRRVETIEVAVDEVVERVTALAGARVRNVVFTGGEPLLQHEQLAAVAARLRLSGFRVEIETNGTIVPPPALAVEVDQWNVSPKLAGSKNLLRARRRPEALTWFALHPAAHFKFVVDSRESISEVDEMVAAFDVPASRIILMPEGTDAETLAERSRWMVDECRARGFRLGARLHVVLWGSTRGT